MHQLAGRGRRVPERVDAAAGDVVRERGRQAGHAGHAPRVPHARDAHTDRRQPQTARIPGNRPSLCANIQWTVPQSW